MYSAETKFSPNKKLVMQTNFVLWGYVVYLPIALALTYYVARILFQNGKVFMLDIFHGREDIALSTNTLFKTGFYLLNIGFALLILKIDANLLNAQHLIEVLSGKIGGFAIYLGLMLFFNMYLFFRGRRVSKMSRQTAPTAPE
jgi:hypothetical protein